MKITTRLFAILPLLALVGCRGAEPGNRSADVEPGSDAERLQGMWEIIDFQAARGDKPGPDKLQAIRLTFAGDRLTITVGTEWRENFTIILDPSKDPKHMTVIEDIGHAPVGPSTSAGTSRGTSRVGTAPVGTARAGTARGGSGPAGQLERSEWIYKFEGDTLVIAVADPGAPRPRDFTPRALAPVGTARGATAARADGGGRVDVIRLRKTNVGVGGSRPTGSTYGYGTSRGPGPGTYRTGSTFRGTAPYPSTARGPTPTAKR
ncbi:MAG TPA: hypothetical protein VKE74_33335 [Gemmataceae bacterium]|nr:hypothetical protein [Gemmataceae bacterium]